MRFLRALLGGLLWILASVVGLLGAVLCVTVILLPLGIPLLMLSRRMFGQAVALTLPRAISHPIDEMGKKARGKGGKAVPRTPDVDKLATSSKKFSKKARKKTAEKAREVTGRKRKRLPALR